MLREIGPRARSAYRHARVALWRFKRSPEQRDRAAALATFAFIGVFALGSVDAIITGGADFGPSNAYAMDYPSARILAPAPAPAPAIESAAEAEAVKTVAVETIDYRFTTEELLGGPLFGDSNDDPWADGFAADGKSFQAQDPVAGVETQETAL